MLSQSELPHHPVTQLVSFYSQMMYVLAVIGARLQGFRYELTINKKVHLYQKTKRTCFLRSSATSTQSLKCASTFSRLSNCSCRTACWRPSLLLAPFLLRIICSSIGSRLKCNLNNLFRMNCGALARGVVFKDFEIQVVSEETAEHIQVWWAQIKTLTTSNLERNDQTETAPTACAPEHCTFSRFIGDEADHWHEAQLFGLE